MSRAYDTLTGLAYLVASVFAMARDAISRVFRKGGR